MDRPSAHNPGEETGSGGKATRRIVAVLFTDLVGSTELLSRMGEGVSEEVRRELFELSAEAIDHCGGTLVKNLGDGVMAVFDATSAAVKAAVMLQKLVHRRNRSAKVPINVRTGCSAGEANVEGGDYFGLPVVEAARLCARAEGGQVLVSELAHQLGVAGSGVDWRLVGPLELKGIDGPLNVWEASFEATEEDAPPAGLVPLPRRLARQISPIFAGRDAILAELLGVLTSFGKQRPGAGDLGALLVSGEAGVGKTSLVVQAAASLNQQGWAVGYGACDEDLAVPYQPLGEVLLPLMEQVPDHRFPRELLESWLRGEARFDELDGGATYRRQRFEAIVTFLRALGSIRPVMVILDDLHWADEGTVAVLQHLVRAVEVGPVAVVGTFREAEVRSASALGGLLATLHREGRVERFRLEGLDTEGVRAFIRDMAGHELDATGEALENLLAAETGGNPFFLQEMLRHLAESGAIVRHEDGRWQANELLGTVGLPASVREVLGRRVGRLGPEVARMLGVASVVGRDFSLPIVSAVMNTTVEDCLELCEAAMASGLLVERDEGRFAFSHALVEHVCYEELSRSRRAVLHQKVAEALEAGVEGEPARASTLARHWSCAPASHVGEAVVRYALLAGDEALAASAPEEAIRWFDQALERLDETPYGQLDSDFRLRARAWAIAGKGQAQHFLGSPSYLALLEEAAAIGEDLGDRDLLVRVALAATRTVATHIGRGWPKVLSWLEQAARATDGERSARRAKVLACYASELYWVDLDHAAEVARQALGLLPEISDPETQGFVARAAAVSLRGPESWRDHRECVEVLEEVAATTGSVPIQISAAAERCFQDCLRCRPEWLIGLKRQETERTDWPAVYRWLLFLGVVVGAYVQGDLERAELLAEEGLRLGQESGEPEAFAFYVAMLGLVRQAQGRLSEVAGWLAETRDAMPAIPAYRCAYALALVSSGDEEGARREISGEIATGAPNFRRDVVWTSTMALFSEVCVELARNDKALRTLLLATADQLKPFAGELPYNGVTIYEVVDFSVGRLLHAAGQLDEAVSWLSRARELMAGIGAKYFQARAEVALAECLADRNGPEDAARARTLATAAATYARSGGYGAVERDALALLAKLG